MLSEDPEKAGPREEQRTILFQYLESSKPQAAEGEESPMYLSDIMETWSLGGRLNNDHILSAVPVILDLL